jgi:glycosyltransferase involved in cell wall biosynthesis
MNTKINVTIAIAAYNEEENIFNLIKTITEQETTSYFLKEIIIISDGSTDNTVKEIKKIKDKRIKIINSKVNLGKIQRVNQIFSIFKKDVLVLYDADINIPNSSTTDNLVKPFIKKSNLDIVYGKQWPMQPQTFIEKLAFFGYEMWDEVKKNLGYKKRRFSSYGTNRAFSKKFTDTYRIPKIKGLSEDSHSFYYSIENNKHTFYSNNSVIYFRLPSTLSDYLNQMSRWLVIANVMESVFDKKLINKYQKISITIKIKAYIKMFLKSPPYISVGYLALQALAKINSKLYKPKLNWKYIESSKKI